MVLARPCQRCVKRGFANNCTEGHRKKAKYLLDEEELGTFVIIGNRFNSFNVYHVFPKEQLKHSKSDNSPSGGTSADPPSNPIGVFTFHLGSLHSTVWQPIHSPKMNPSSRPPLTPTFHLVLRLRISNTPSSLLFWAILVQQIRLPLRHRHNPHSIPLGPLIRSTLPPHVWALPVTISVRHTARTNCPSNSRTHPYQLRLLMLTT